jgi:hypothetical protein
VIGIWEGFGEPVYCTQLGVKWESKNSSRGCNG